MEQEKSVTEMDINELRKLMIGKAIINSSDMQGDLLQEAQDVIQSGIENNSAPVLNIEAACKYIKENLDKKFGPTWQCIIGEGYAYDVTVQNNTLLFMFYNGNLAVLIFKS
ncbi:hypothetical protein ABPG74_011120 [Tetrahymena malaccensis]